MCSKKEQGKFDLNAINYECGVVPLLIFDQVELEVNLVLLSPCPAPLTLPAKEASEDCS